MPFVFDFDHTHAARPWSSRTSWVARAPTWPRGRRYWSCPVPPGFTISTEACRAYMAGGCPRPSTRVAGARARLEKAMGKTIGDARTRCWSRCARGQVLHARHDGHRPRPRPQRRVRRGSGQADRETSDSPSTPTGASSPCTPASSSNCPGRSSTRSSTPPRTGRTTSDPRCRPAVRYLVDSYRQIVERHTGKPFPQKPVEQLARRHQGRVPQLERSPGHRLPRPGAHRPRPRHRGQRPGHGLRRPRRQLGTGVGFTTTPPPAPGRLQRLPGQRPGRRRRGRHPQHRADL